MLFLQYKERDKVFFLYKKEIVKHLKIEEKKRDIY